MQQYARDHGVADHLVTTDRVSDTALRVLYQRCAAFVFPSLYEGFGLPILEAMHCGAPVIAGNNSSQIEVVGDAGLLFNVANAGELAAQLVRVLDDEGLAQELRERAVVQARRFRWEDTADKALDVLTQSHVSKPAVQSRSSRKRVPRRRIAFFSPLPPLRSGISDYSARLLDELKQRYTIDLYHDAGYVPHIGLSSVDFGCYDHRLFERNARVLGYDAVVYQMGNNPYHGYIYETLLRYPGIVTVHDLNLAGFQFWYAGQLGVDGEAHIRREFEAFCGAGAEKTLHSLAAFADTPWGIPRACIQQGYHLNGRIFEHATAVIVHSPWCAEQVRSWCPAHLAKTSIVAFGATALDISPEQRRAIRARFQIPQNALIIASLGLLQATKMNAEAIAAFAPLARVIPEALLIFIGPEVDNGEARRKVMELGLQHQVRFLGHQPGDLAELASMADIGVCLRRPPTNGETSAALMDLLRVGVPTIVSDVGTFSCYPDSVVRKHCWDSSGLAGLTQALRELAEDRPGARPWAARRGTMSNRTMAGRAQPTRMKRSSSGPPRDGPGPERTGPQRCRFRSEPPRRKSSTPHRETSRPATSGSQGRLARRTGPHPQTYQVSHEGHDQEAGPNPLADLSPGAATRHSQIRSPYDAALRFGSGARRSPGQSRLGPQQRCARAGPAPDPGRDASGADTRPSVERQGRSPRREPVGGRRRNRLTRFIEEAEI